MHERGLSKFTDSDSMFKSVAEERERMCASRLQERVFVPVA
jgi:hypothetical protein